MLRVIAHLGLLMLLVVALVSATCLACPPVKAGGCCDPAGHCKKVSKSCDNAPSAVLTAVPPVIGVPVAAAERVPALSADSSSPFVPLAHDSPPDLCLLHSIFRV